MEIQKINFINNIPVKNHHFHEPQDKNKYGFKLFMTSAFIGPPRSGKTLTAINLSKYLLDKNLISEIILISPTFENNPFYVLNIPEENIISELDDIQNILLQVNEYCKSEVEKWKNLKKSMTEKQYNKFYKKIYKIYKCNEKNPEIILDDELLLSDEDLDILKNNKYQKKPFYYHNGPSFLIILDDINGTSIIADKKVNPLTQIISNHRHNHINLFILIQNYSRGIQANIRRLIKQYFLFKFNDLKEVKQFYDEIASAYFPNFDLFKNVYRRVTNVEHNFLLIDNEPKDENLKIRQNFNELIKI